MCPIFPHFQQVCLEERLSLVPKFSPAACTLISSLLMVCFNLARSQSPMLDSGAVSRIIVWTDHMQDGSEWSTCIAILHSSMCPTVPLISLLNAWVRLVSAMI